MAWARSPESITASSCPLVTLSAELRLEIDDAAGHRRHHFHGAGGIGLHHRGQHQRAGDLLHRRLARRRAASAATMSRRHHDAIADARKCGGGAAASFRGPPSRSFCRGRGTNGRRPRPEASPTRRSSQPRPVRPGGALRWRFLGHLFIHFDNANSFCRTRKLVIRRADGGTGQHRLATQTRPGSTGGAYEI